METLEMTSRIILMYSILFCFVENTSAAEINGSTNAGIREMKIKLHSDRIANYGPTVNRPVKNESTPVRVRMRMLVDHLVDFNEPKQDVTLFCSLRLEWTDEYLTWDENEYGGLTSLEVDVDQIWTPSVTLITSNDGDFLKLHHRQVYVSSTGQVTWLSPAIITSSCLFDVYLFPFDVQNCSLQFGPWANPHHLEDLDFFFENNETTVERYRNNGVWEICGEDVERVLKKYSVYDEPFAEVYYHIAFRRQYQVYVLALIIPSLMLSFSSLLIFLLPPESGEKISFGITNLLAMVLFQETVRLSIPSSGCPVFADYICVMVVVASASLVSEAMILRMYNYGEERKVPGWMRRYLLKEPTRYFPQKQEDRSGAFTMTTSKPREKEVAGRVDPLEQNGCMVPRMYLTSLSEVPQDPGSLGNGEMWKRIAVSIESKLSIMFMLVIAGNIAYNALKICVNIIDYHK